VKSGGRYLVHELADPSPDVRGDPAGPVVHDPCRRAHRDGGRVEGVARGCRLRDRAADRRADAAARARPDDPRRGPARHRAVRVHRAAHGADGEHRSLHPHLLRGSAGRRPCCSRRLRCRQSGVLTSRCLQSTAFRNLAAGLCWQPRVSALAAGHAACVFVRGTPLPETPV
jgi:hypothetical protein